MTELDRYISTCRAISENGKYQWWARLAELLEGERFVSRASRDVLAERARQIEEEGWAPEHDDQHRSAEMAIAAACYALNASDDSDGPELRLAAAEIWPWADKWWKPTETRRDLVKAGALIIAEIERLDRGAAKRWKE